MFKSNEELNETLEILSTAYGKDTSITKSFKIKDGQIVFTGDSFCTPCTDLALLSDYGVVERTLIFGGEYLDTVAIEGCDIQLLRKLSLPLRLNSSQLQDQITELKKPLENMCRPASPGTTSGTLFNKYESGQDCRRDPQINNSMMDTSTP